jgi:hypothetical protein
MMMIIIIIIHPTRMIPPSTGIITVIMITHHGHDGSFSG